MNKSQSPLAVAELLDLSGHCALVTGASGNIGRGIARRLAEAGATVVVHYATAAQKAEALLAEIAADGGRALLASGDLRCAASTAKMFARLDRDSISFDLLVNNAAIQPVEMLHETTAAEWRLVQESNLDSAFMVSQNAIGRWRDRGVPGSIVNIASIEGLDPAKGHAHYAASKAALLMMTRAMALEYGRQAIRVNAVSPGLIDRDGLVDDWPEGVERWQKRAPLRRLGLPSDVADAVLFLLSPGARWISGANLVVDGGMSAVSRW